ncbi:GntR family transcriptional regulator [Mycolicibacterium parafortuitum]|uniref:FadR/GntR family transcriptional regulator n=1 Tax=Mycolicibacterium parafortuitum TaxID=39692 RepID=UPI0032C3F817
MRDSLVDQVAGKLLAAITDGDIPPDGVLPSESELAAQWSVSRLTIREAIKSLRVRNIVRVERGRGTFVNPLSEWTALEPALLAARVANDHETARQLIELRKIVETGAAEVAAARRTYRDLADLADSISDMETAMEADDLTAIVAADLRFHEAIFAATHNPFLAVLLEPIGAAVLEGRTKTSAVPEIRRHALQCHRQIFAAIEAGLPVQAREAMAAHMDQTAEDSERFLSNPAHEQEQA